jgi:hypothetical protein
MWSLGYTYKFQECACVADEDRILCIQVYTPMEGVPERMSPVIPSSGKRRLHPEGSSCLDSPIDGVMGRLDGQVILKIFLVTYVVCKAAANAKPH